MIISTKDLIIENELSEKTFVYHDIMGDFTNYETGGLQAFMKANLSGFLPRFFRIFTAIQITLRAGKNALIASIKS